MVFSNVCAETLNIIGVEEEIDTNEEESEIVEEDITPPRGDRNPLCNDNNDKTCMSEAGNWYCKHTNDGSRPPIPSEMSYILDHNGYFLGEDEKVIYLTFDAGFENGNIEKILDVLKEEDVKGAFFILENLVKRNTDLVKRMVEDGHTVCNHTASHYDMTKMKSKEEFEAELNKMNSVFTEYTGYELQHYYRPPEGRLNEENLIWADELGYKTVLWSYAYADWDNNNQMNTEKAYNKVISGTHNGEIILLHPTSDTNAKIISHLIKEWKSMGYRFGELSELTKSGENK